MMTSGLGGMQHRGRCLWTKTTCKKFERCASFLTRSFPLSDDFAVLGLTPSASKTDVKHAYKRLALKYHPDVIRGDNLHEKQEIFKEIKFTYERLMDKFEGEEESQTSNNYDEFEEWDEWMGFEGGIPMIYNSTS
ncbi:Chaperone dnaj-domain superfamily protein [Thalictrum thalictroides]|uniref:Chaperone dnaj-domain superfamily protein n=1 Tax=Thalictrum thalictroides TaxID=46969 RepID=A0A7J6VUB9_THATH|nr:Chaperone dnaj-domain superfamily protein [Thalictrum thalictroides]